jgi:hypothetical protein
MCKEPYCNRVLVKYGYCSGVVELKRINAPTSLGWVYIFDEFLNTQRNHMKQQFDKASYLLRNGRNGSLTNHHINLKGKKINLKSKPMSAKTAPTAAAPSASSLPFFVLLSPNLAILSTPF